MAAAHVRGGPVLSLVVIACAYYTINALSDLIWRYTCGMESIEQLQTVQVNRFQEKVNARASVLVPA